MRHSLPQYIRRFERPLDAHRNECIHHVRCDGTCVSLSPGPQQPRQPHVHLCGRNQPPESHWQHQAVQQEGTNILLLYMNETTTHWP